MSSLVQPFQPIATVTVTANSSAAQTVALLYGETVLIYNSSADVAFVQLETNATNTSTPVPAGARLLLYTGPYKATISALSNSVNTGTIFFTMGVGTAY
jgi:hypothetical protein